MFKKFKNESITIEKVEDGKYLVFNNMKKKIKSSSYIEEKEVLKEEINKMIDEIFEED
jgi:hypothetical protein